jgi:small-conductance mechanosensitive channel
MYGKLIVAGVAFAAGWQVNSWRLESNYHKEKVEILVQAKKDLERLERQAEEIERTKDKQIRAITGRLNATVEQLRQRPERVPVTPACEGATGAELSRPDAEFLAREAARADRLRQALAACYQLYDGVRNGAP